MISAIAAYSFQLYHVSSESDDIFQGPHFFLSRVGLFFSLIFNYNLLQRILQSCEVNLLKVLLTCSIQIWIIEISLKTPFFQSHNWIHFLKVSKFFFYFAAN